MRSTSSFRTQMVMPSGIQTRSPATKYRLSVAMPRASAMRQDEAAQPPEPAACDEPPAEPSVLLSDFVSAFVSAFASLFASLFASAFAAGFEPFLKSVAYQPLPLSWNPAAVSIFWNVGFPHEVQTVSGWSLHFWRNSCWWPQPEQRYS